jgi:hypothetical protein
MKIVHPWLRRICAGKQAFSSRDDARKATHGQKQLEVYRCDICGLFHIASTLTYKKRRWGKR